MRNNRAIAIAALGALPMGLLVVWSLGTALQEFARGGAYPGAAIFLILVQGGIVVAIELCMMGAMRVRPGLSVLGAGLTCLSQLTGLAADKSF